VLFVTYTFPPARAVGSVRVWNIAKYLARSGWVVSVVTPHPSVWRHVEDPEGTETKLEREGVRRLATGHRWRWLAANSVNCASHRLAWLAGGLGRRAALVLGIERTIGWIRAAELACSSVRPGDVDVILASGPPFAAFVLAQRLAGRLGCPYVLDYRDLWSGNLYGEVRGDVRKEESVLAGSAAVTIVSPSWGSVLANRFGVGTKLHVISNGYDAEELASIEPHDFGHFAIVYTGRLAPPKRPISPVMAALRRLDEVAYARSARWTLHYYGSDGEHVRQEAERFRLTEKIVVHDKVPRSQALSAMKGANLAVVITSIAEHATAEDNGMVTAKIFEAIGLGTPTLLIAPSGSDARAVGETSGLVRSFAAADLDGIASFIEALMEGELPEPKDPAAYAWTSLVGGLEGVLSGVIEQSGQRVGP
jgi:glycosyltransferase involved in cell wall biosynthesis